MRLLLSPVLPLCLCLAACADLPEVSALASPEALAADYPKLVPLDPLLEGISTNPTFDPASLNRDIAAQKARADALRQARVNAPRPTQRGIGRPGTNSELTERLRRLQARAEALRRAPF